MTRSTIAAAIVRGLLALLLVLPTTVQAAPKIHELPPSSPWHVHWGDNFCLLQQTYGKDKDLLTLRFLTFTPESGYQVQLIGRQVSFDPSKGTIALAFLPGPESQAHAQLGRMDSGERTILFSVRIANDLREAIALASRLQSEAREDNTPDTADSVIPVASDVTGLAIKLGARAFQLDTGPLTKPLAALRECSTSLLTKWGIDPAVQAKVVSRAHPIDREKLVRAMQAVYPLGAAQMGKQGRVNAVVTVDAQGQPIGCRVPLSQNDKAFDDQVCKTLSKFAFQPATQADGTPVTSYWTLTTIFTLN
ncbi:energy transducer TonB [Novosphingobium sp. 1949]|uniref:Energy transducer TonB n=1 Tax=Novosphingobium organovorum TaxID=2930092 RepID=A0ABT0BDH8_9SPHN|nr:energy transducer TonB [Novosphingobium organovorum]MCJ2182849.1 energy transducer TonB [Novosphingobium organovorum]